METVACHSQPPPPLSPILVDELIIEILSWLPVKSLLQCRCVSKSWKFLISNNPNFVKLHLSRSPKNANLILTFQNFNDDDDDGQFDFRAISCSKNLLFKNPFPVLAVEEDRCFRMNDCYLFIGSCNGLVCFCSHDYSMNNEFTEYQIHFWNPALRLTSQMSSSLCVNNMPVNPCFPVFGYGYDNKSDTYKVVAMILSSENTIVKVHSMGGNCWRQISSLPKLPVVGENNGQLVNGTLNWLVHGTPGFDNNRNTFPINQLGIFSFHLEEETYQQFSLPSGLDEVLSVEPELRVLGDCLCFCHYYKGTHFIIWKMTEFGVIESWSQLFNISDRHLQIDTVHPLVPLCTSENDDVVVLAKCNDCEIILYNRINNRVEHSHNNFEELMEANDYVESLVLPC